MDDHTHTMAEYQKIAKAMDVFNDNPDLFMDRASGTNGQPADPYYLHALTCHVDFGWGQRTVEAFATLLKMLLEGYTRPRIDPLERLTHAHGLSAPYDWEAPLLAIVRMSVDIAEDSFQGPEDYKIGDVIDVEWKRVLEVLSKDLSAYVGNDVRANARRHSAIAFCRFITLFRGVAPDMRRNQTQLDLVLTCWAGIAPPLRAESRGLMLTMFDLSGKDVSNRISRSIRPDECIEAMDKDERRVGSGNFSMLLKSCKRWLGESNIIDDSLQWELECIAMLLEYDEELSDAFFAARIDEHVMAAIRRQGKEGAAARYRDVVDAGFRVFKTMSSNVFASASIRQLSAGLLDLAFSTACHDVERNKGTQEVFCSHSFSYLYIIIRVMGKERDEPRKWTQEFEDAVRSQVETMFISMQTRIIRLKNGHHSEVLTLLDETWRNFYILMRVSEVDVWQRTSMASMACNNRSCTGKEADGTLKRCSRCRVARYCSGQCENTDWSEHRAQCEVIPVLFANVPGYSNQR